MNLLKKKNKYLSHNNSVKSGAGFTIIELIVSVGIIAVISGVVFWNNRQFNDRVIINAAAEEASLAIREAQNYGVSVRESSSGSGQFTSGYGIVFDNTNPSTIIVFGDINGNKIYDGDINCSDTTDICADKTSLRNGVTINSQSDATNPGLCAYNLSNNKICDSSWKSISATFVRPNLDATITVVNNSGFIVPGPWISGKITLMTKGGALKTVSISNTGQISIQ